NTGTLRNVAIWILRILAAVLIVGIALSATDSNQWWIRAWDFPRTQLLFAMLGLAVALWLLDRGPGGRARIWMPVVLVGLSMWQVYRIFPYTPASPIDVEKIAVNTGEDTCFSVMSLNVLQKNRQYARTLAMIEQVDPDILLLMETDAGWAEAMEPALAQYPHRRDRVLDNTYGLMFATRMPMRDASIRDLAQKDTPSIFATLTADGQDFTIVGLHPRPPVPGQDTEERDAELIVAAKMLRDRKMPALAFGDFNDVAWSDTTRLFRQTGQLIDPRVGRGTYATFPADMTWLGWPLDHVFVTDAFLFSRMEVLDKVGSDHRPIVAELCLNPKLARANNAQAEDATAEDMQDAAKTLDEFEEKARGD
ncbi:MAG: endonuclease/exonuclease/phosphatase family protein, partial [Pontixanthobacter sp.]